MEKRIEEFEVIGVNRHRGVCRDCRHRQRQQRRASSSSRSSLAYTNDDTVSIVSQTSTYHPSMHGGESEHLRAIDEDGVDHMTPPPKSPAVASRQLDARIRPLEEQLRALTDEHRQGGMPSIGQRLVQLEHEMQSVRGGNGCECSARDPLWEIFVWLVCTTAVFVLLRWVEGRLWSRRTEDERKLPLCQRDCAEDCWSIDAG
jgi:hypothetical protein